MNLLDNYYDGEVAYESDSIEEDGTILLVLYENGFNIEVIKNKDQYNIQIKKGLKKIRQAVAKKKQALKSEVESGVNYIRYWRERLGEN